MKWLFWLLFATFVRLFYGCFWLISIQMNSWSFGWEKSLKNWAFFFWKSQLKCFGDGINVVAGDVINHLSNENGGFTNGATQWILHFFHFLKKSLHFWKDLHFWFSSSFLSLSLSLSLLTFFFIFMTFSNVSIKKLIFKFVYVNYIANAKSGCVFVFGIKEKKYIEQIRTNLRNASHTI